MKSSKRYKEAKNSIQKKNYLLKDALNLVKEINKESPYIIKLSASLNVSKIKQFSIRDFLEIPHVVKNLKIAVFDDGISDDLKSNKEFLFINIEDLEKIIQKRNKKQWGFDRLLAKSSVVEKMKKISRRLSSKKMFPNLKDGTVFVDENNVSSYSKKIEIRSDKNGNLHFLIGKSSFKDSEVEENYSAILNKIKSLKPVNWKGEYLKSLTLSTTMGPGIKVSF